MMGEMALTSASNVEEGNEISIGGRWVVVEDVREADMGTEWVLIEAEEYRYEWPKTQQLRVCA